MTRLQLAVAAVAMLLALLLALLRFLQQRRRQRVSGSVELLSEGAHAPGDAVRVALHSDKLLVDIVARLEFTPLGRGGALTVVPGALIAQHPTLSGWRAELSAKLPADAPGEWSGAWALTVSGVSEHGVRCEQTQPIAVRPFFLQPQGARSAGEGIRAILETAARPAVLKAALTLYNDAAVEPLRVVAARVSSAERTSHGWRTVVEAEMPSDARPAFEDQWVLSVADAVENEDGPSVDEEERVDLR